MRSARTTRGILLLLCAALIGCPQTEEDPRISELEQEITRLRLALGESQARRVACEEDDRFLYSSGMRALDSGDAALACDRFAKLAERYPASPLVEIAQERREDCSEALSEVEGESESADTTAAKGDGPISIERAWLREDQFGVPLAHVRFRNQSSSTIRRYKLAIQCYDARGGVLRHLTNGEEWFVAAGVSERIPPGQFAKGGPWAMTGFLTCHRFDVVPLSVRFDDGSTWER